jgi:hypothetical protein
MVLDRIWKPIEEEKPRPSKTKAPVAQKVAAANGTNGAHAGQAASDEETVAAELP